MGAEHLEHSPIGVEAEREINRDKDPRSSRAYLFISGSLGANHGLVGINNAFREITDSQHVLVMNSIISMDEPNPQRHEQQAKFIKENLEAGKEVEVIGQSLGTVEAARAIAIIREQDPHFFDNPEIASKLTLTYNASAGLERKLPKQILFFLKYLALRGSVNRAINSSNAFPPKNMTSEQLADGMRWLFGKEKPANMISFEDMDGNYEQLPEEIKEKLADKDAKIKALTEKKRKLRAKRKWKQRGKIVSGELQQVYDGKYVKGNDLSMAPAVDPIHLARQPHIRQAIKEILTESVYAMASYLLGKGAKLKVVGFEHDRVVTRKSMRYFVDKTAIADNKGEIYYLELLGHSGAVLQARYFVDAITKRKEDYPML